MSEERLYSVKEVLDLCHISRRQLFYYEEKGMITAIRNRENNYRYYTEEMITRLAFIAECREVGFGLAAIQQMLINGDAETLKSAIRQAMSDARGELDKHILKYEKSMEKFNAMLEAAYLLDTKHIGLVSQVKIPARNIVYYDYTDNFINSPFEYYKRISKLEDIIQKNDFCKLSPCMYQFENHFNAENGEFLGKPAKIRLFYEVKESSSACPAFAHIEPAAALSTVSIGDYDKDLKHSYENIFHYAREHNIKLKPISIEEGLLDDNLSYNNSNMWVTRINVLID